MEHHLEASTDGQGRVDAVIAAAKNGHLEVVIGLLAHGADIDCAASNGATPVFMASLGGHIDVVGEGRLRRLRFPMKSRVQCRSC